MFLKLQGAKESGYQFWGEVFVYLFLPHLVSTAALEQLQGHRGHSRVAQDRGGPQGRKAAGEGEVGQCLTWRVHLSPAGGQQHVRVPAFAAARESSVPPRQAQCV